MSQKLAIVGGRVWTGTAGAATEEATVLINDGRITAVESPAAFVVPPDAEVISAAGCTVLPGLMDMHVHLATNSDYRVVEDNSGFLANTPLAAKSYHALRNAQLALRAGFTSLRVIGHRGAGEVELRGFIDAGLLLGPRLSVAPWWITMTGGHGDAFLPKTYPRRAWDTADGPDECRALVRLQHREGGDFIKVMASGGMLSHGDNPHHANYSIAELEAILHEAHTLGMKVTAHAHSVEGVRRCLAAGFDSIEHGTFAATEEDVLQQLRASGTPVIPTLSLNDWVVNAQGDLGAGPGRKDDVLAVVAEQRAHFVTALKGGVKIVMGTDSAGNLCPFGGNARELELYVELGMEPHEALTSATIEAAKLLGRESELGSVTVGKLADLVVVDGNPLEDITLLRGGGIRRIILDGNDITDRLEHLRLD